MGRFVILTVLAYSCGIGLMLLINEAMLGLEGFAPWPLAWFLWFVACWPGLAAGIIARWSGAAPPRALALLHLLNTTFIIGMIECSYLFRSDTALYITIIAEIALIYLVMARVRR